MLLSTRESLSRGMTRVIFEVPREGRLSNSLRDVNANPLEGLNPIHWQEEVIV